MRRRHRIVPPSFIPSTAGLRYYPQLSHKMHFKLCVLLFVVAVALMCPFGLCYRLGCPAKTNMSYPLIFTLSHSPVIRNRSRHLVFAVPVANARCPLLLLLPKHHLCRRR